LVEVEMASKGSGSRTGKQLKVEEARVAAALLPAKSKRQFSKVKQRNK
jgi:hypothetical protein